MLSAKGVWTFEYVLLISIENKKEYGDELGGGGGKGVLGPPFTLGTENENCNFKPFQMFCQWTVTSKGIVKC